MGDFALDGLFEELQREFGPVAQARDLRLFVTAAPHRVHSDRAMLGAVLRNLLSNALKYTREGEVRLHCQPVAEGLRIEVRDTGVGIAAEHLGSICEEFYQVAPVPGVSREGYGLGLSIVARLLKLLGLRLEVDTVPGKGSSFAVCVPLAAGEPAWRDDPPPGPAAVASATATPGGARARRILLVEDDEGVRNATRLLLKLEGFQVTAAASLLQALNATTGSSPELLITDYHLGAGESGLDVIRALRARHGATLPAILVSGDTSPGVQQIPEDASLHRIAKPIHAEQLLALIRQLLP
jgi:two-component system CheB/CheR fusion protein